MLHKRINYGFSGYLVPFVPRAARSARRRGPIHEKVVDKQLCAIDVLATVAGNLLERENATNRSTEENLPGNVQASDVDMEEQGKGDLLLRAEHCDKGGSEVVSHSLELGLPIQDENCILKVHDAHNDITSALASMITSSHYLENAKSFIMIDTNDEKSDFCSQPQKPEVCVTGQIDSFAPNLNGCVKKKGGVQSDNGHNMLKSVDPKIFNGMVPAAASSDCSIKFSLGMDRFGSLSHSRDNDVNIVTRDDDENSSECTQPSTVKATRLPARIGNRRIRKLLTSKYWRAASNVKNADRQDTELCCLYHNRRTGYKRQRSQRIYPFKKRKFYHYSALSTSNGGTRCNGVYDAPDMAIDRTVAAFHTRRHGVNGSSSCAAGKNTSFASKESHVKLRIKSFRVPELYIEMPETATIGSLKRTVMNAVTSLLGDGFRVGMLLQGKKIRDDDRTLEQSGLCHDENVESLGFTLEPNPLHAGTPACSDDNSLTLSVDVPHPMSGCPTTAVTLHEAPHDHLMPIVGNLIESDHDSAPSPTEMTADKCAVDSRALVALPNGTPQALAVAPALQKSKRSDMAQRRIRRPFSVSEVEALVQAVEKLGTGRWRDVKLRAFDNVKHRTYVDLKDKWKTLVHTARISPQQRRGEPVPQELLDRVLSAHSYWSQQQAKQQLKQPSDPCLLI